MSENQDSVTRNVEFRKFCNTLQAVQFAAIDYVREGKSDEEMKSRATEVTFVLASAMKGVGANKNNNQMMNIFDETRCWDPVTKQFVAC